MPDDAIERARQTLAEVLAAWRSGRNPADEQLLRAVSPVVPTDVAIRAMLAFASQQAPEGWRPIDTAWQAGSNPVIVTDGQSVHGGAWWHSREEAWLGCDGIVPTKWQPLPAPPAMLDAAPSVTLGEVA